MNTLRAHSTKHFVSHTRAYGSALGFDTADSEHDHIANVKKSKTCTSRGVKNMRESAFCRIVRDRSCERCRRAS